MKNDKVGLGLMAQFMNYGYTKSQSLYASYAYHIKLSTGKISFGLKAGFDRSNTDYTGIATTDPGDPVFITNDEPYFLPNVGAGAYYFTERLFAGFSIPAFLSYRKNTSTNSAEAYHSFNNYDIIFSGGGLINFSQTLKFKPSVLIDYSLETTKKLTQFDLTATDYQRSDLGWRFMENI